MKESFINDRDSSSGVWKSEEMISSQETAAECEEKTFFPKIH